MMRLRILVSLAAAFLCLAACTPGVADIIAFEDFDGGALNLNSTANVFDFDAGGGTDGDVFGRVSQFAGGAGTGGPFDVFDDSVVDTSGGGVFPGDSRGISGQFGTAFFAMNDADAVLDVSGAPLNNAVWTFDISSALAIDNIQMDIAAMGDFEASSLDGFLVEAQIDGGGYQEIFRGVTDEAASKVYRLMDDGTVPIDTNDPLELFIDGVATGTFLDKSVAATGLFDTFVSTAFAGSSGLTMDIRISWAGTPSGSEPMGFDNFTINGTIIPEPTGLVLLSLAVLGAGLAIRRRGVQR